MADNDYSGAPHIVEPDALPADTDATSGVPVEKVVIYARGYSCLHIDRRFTRQLHAQFLVIPAPFLLRSYPKAAEDVELLVCFAVGMELIPTDQCV